MSVAGGTAGIETGQLLIIKRYLCLIASVITNVSITAFSPIVLSFTHTFVINQNEILHADGIYLSIQQCKLVFLLSHDMFTDSFFVGVVNLTAFTVSQKIVILSSTITRTLIPSQSLLRVFCQSVCLSIYHITSEIKQTVECS